MAKVTKPIILDETGQAIVRKLSEQNNYLSIIAKGTAKNTWKDIQETVRAGMASSAFSAGDIFYTHYKTESEEYSIPWHVCGVRNITTPKAETKEALIIQMHKMLPTAVQFDNYEAFYKVRTQPLSAGTYHVVIGDNYGTYVKAGDVYSFTLAKSVPVGGVLTGFENTPYSGFDGMKIRSYATNADTTAIEEVVPRKATEGTKLGDLTNKGTSTMNGLQQVCYGCNDWDKSYVRQWLNNSGKEFWVAKHDYDRPPTNFRSVDGFRTGFDSDFLSVLGEFKSITGLNTVYHEGGTVETFDKFALPSLEQMNIKKQVEGEGETFPYWKEALGSTPIEWYKDTPLLIHHDMNNSPRYVWLRSASVGGADNAWSVYPSGGVGNGSAYGAFCSAPLAAIY